MKTLSVKLPASLDARLAALARRKGQTKSALTREILSHFLSRERFSCLDLVADLVGCVSGPRDLATNNRYMRDFGR
jgi:hypothetical protein